MWHEPTKQWVLDSVCRPSRVNPARTESRRPNHTIHFFTSPNLKDWTLRSVTPGLYECPDFFELPVDGDEAKKKWVLTAASSEYFIGTFDGEKFTPETPKLPGQRGRGFYAAQTFSDLPDGRRIQIGWGQDPSPGNAVQSTPVLPLRTYAAQHAGGAATRAAANQGNRIAAGEVASRGRD